MNATTTSKPRTTVSDVYQSRPADGAVGTVPSAFTPVPAMEVTGPVPVWLGRERARDVVRFVLPLLAFIPAATLAMVGLPMVIR